MLNSRLVQRPLKKLKLALVLLKPDIKKSLLLPNKLLLRQSRRQKQELQQWRMH
jgi:hypothetical protein